MLVILSAGMLTGLTATTIQATPVFADKEECEKNSDNNCNQVKDRGQLITMENNCKGGGSGDSNGGKSGDGSTSGAGGISGENNNAFSCSNTIDDPNTGDSNTFNGQKQTEVVSSTPNDVFVLPFP